MKKTLVDVAVKEDIVLNKSVNLVELAKTLSGKKVLFVGIGGGCDVISAYCVYKMMDSRCRKATGKGIDEYYGNTKRKPSSTNQSIKGLNYVFKVCEKFAPLKPKCVTYGSTMVSDSIPRNSKGCPLIFVLPKKKEKEKIKEFVKELGSFQFDCVIGVDAGGDSMPGCGVDTDDRDKEMLEALKLSCKKSSITLFHFVLGPGCDGESAPDTLRKALGKLDKEGKYVGGLKIPLDVIKRMEILAKELKNRRTPNLIVRNHFNKLQSPKENKNYVLIPRSSRHPIPKLWVSHLLFLKYTNQSKEVTKKKK